MKWANCYRLKYKIQSDVGALFGADAYKFINDNFWFNV